MTTKDVQRLTHIDETGSAKMVDVSEKDVTLRRAVAEASITMSVATLDTIRHANVPKGDVLATAKLAGIMAAKQTSNLIPLCHSLPLDQVDLTFTFEANSIRIRAEARTEGKTGVEMEALTAASIAALTIYDMAKALDRAMVIGGTRLLEKHGGKSGSWRAPAS